jgi:hypothetical protein
VLKAAGAARAPQTFGNITSGPAGFRRDPDGLQTVQRDAIAAELGCSLGTSLRLRNGGIQFADGFGKIAAFPTIDHQLPGIDCAAKRKRMSSSNHTATELCSSSQTSISLISLSQAS